MYHRLLNIFIASSDPQLEALLQAVSPQENFSHQFHVQPDVDEASLKGCAVIIVDFETVGPDATEWLQAAKDEQAVVIGCFTADKLPMLAANHHLFDQVWVKPLVEDNVLSSFAGVLYRIKAQEDAALNQKYLDTLIDSLPDLIWFKDAKGAHLKVNEEFSKTVNKTKAQIEGRGHYYIWDIEPDEYAEGEFICLESEEEVLDKKETCLFDETVKCGDELRKFKTYKSPIFDTDGEVIGTVGLAHDVTDLQNLMIELNILIESLPFAVMVTDKNGDITTINQRFVDIFNWDRAELINQRVDSFFNELRAFTRSKRWIVEYEEGGALLLSESTVLKVHDESLLDIFGVQVGHIYLFLDITLEHQYKSKLLSEANTDYLTKLNNRRSLQSFMRRTANQPGTALLLVDLDNFKEVNDQYGHDEGDRLLVAFSDLLHGIFPAENLFRLGGDEFAILLPYVESPAMPEQYAEQLVSGFETGVAQQYPDTNVSVSIGIAMDLDSASDFDDLFKRADMALYESKKSGKARSLSEKPT